MKHQRKSKKCINVIFLISVVLFVCSFSFLIICRLLKTYGYGNFWWPYIGSTSFFVCNIVALLLLLSIWKDAASYEKEEKSQKQETLPLSQLKNLSRSSIEQTLFLQKFMYRKDGYFRKKIWSLLKDDLCYYIRIAVSSDILYTVKEEFDRFNHIKEKSRNICLILFIYVNHLDEQNIKELRKISNRIILTDMVFPAQFCFSNVSVLIDSTTNEAYFIDIPQKTNLSLYAYGCRFIKKIFKVT